MTAEEEIKQMTLNKSITQDRLSKESGVSQGLISDYFSGKKQMSANRYLYLKKLIKEI